MNRILLVASIFPPEIGGPATFIDQLAHELSREGYVVTVVCSSTGRDISDFSRPFRVIRVFSRLWAIQIYKMIPVLAWQMLWHDAVLVNGFEYSAYWASLITRRRYTLKIVGDSAWEEARGSGISALSIDDFQKMRNFTGRVKRLHDWRKKYLERANRIIVPSEYLKRLVTGWGVLQTKIRVVYNGVLFSSELIDQPRYRDLEKPLQVVFVGRLTNWKGVETLLLAVSQVNDLEVHILGDGPEYPLLFNLAEQLHLSSRVKFLGSLDHTILLNIMRKMDVLVLGSSYEGLSHTLLEACSISLPCVASNSGGNQEIISDGENGLLFNYGDVNVLAALLQLLHNDEELRLKLARKARQHVEKFDFNKTIEGTIQVLLEQK
ncbi:MAG: glycosyltransferase family 4 protein [Anaerolineales bacterium]|nr:glycosyltransferase family 4 protein [Anaerolineales bacterium]